MKKHRLLAFLVLFMLLASLMPSCSGNGGELGEIEDVEITDTDEDPEKPVFEKQENPFRDYTYKTVKCYAAKMSFEIPTGWEAESLNPSCIRITTPVNDTHLPGNTFYVQYIYDFSTEGNDLDDSSGSAEYFYRPFMTYIEGLRYSVGGSAEGSLRRWRGGWSVSETPSFVSDDTLAHVVTSEEEILYRRKTTSVILADATFTAAFYKWQGFPVMISTFSEAGQAEDARTMVEYIMSTSTYLQQKIGQTEEKAFGSYTLTLPSGFESEKSEPHVFRSSDSAMESTAGISVACYIVDSYLFDQRNTSPGGEEDEITDDAPVEGDPDYMSDDDFVLSEIGSRLAYDLSDPAFRDKYMVTMSGAVEGVKSDDGIDHTIYTACDFMTDEDNETAAACQYGPAAAYPVNIYFKRGSDKGYLIAVMFAPQQEKIADTIGKLAIRSIKD